MRKQRETQRKDRRRAPLPHAAIVGYTNAGKSSLLNRLTGAEVQAEDKLFATLDTTTRKLELDDGQTLLMTDTVGFVRRLPHGLVESFKATLEEAVLADFLVHVVDGSARDVYDHHTTTLEVLAELGADEKRMILAINKIDQIDAARRHELATHFEGAVLVSVHTGEGLGELVARMGDMLLSNVVRHHLRIPQARPDLVALLHREGKILSEEYRDRDVDICATYPKRFLANFAEFVIAEPSPAPREGRRSNV